MLARGAIETKTGLSGLTVSRSVTTRDRAQSGPVLLAEQIELGVE